MSTTGNTVTISVNKDREKSGSIKWSFCPINPVVQVIEHYYNLRKKN